jgi:hypothetical protein
VKNRQPTTVFLASAAAHSGEMQRPSLHAPWAVQSAICSPSTPWSHIFTASPLHTGPLIVQPPPPSSPASGATPLRPPPHAEVSAAKQTSPTVAARVRDCPGAV